MAVGENAQRKLRVRKKIFQIAYVNSGKSVLVFNQTLNLTTEEEGQ